MREIKSGRNPEIEYFELLSSIEANLLDDTRMKKINDGLMDVHNKKFLWIRHDIDYDLNKAFAMALAEKEHGYYATYFLLHTSPYWDHPNFDEVVKAISDLGHNIGIHNNALTLEHEQGSVPFVTIKRAKDRIEKITNFPVYSTSAHGDRLCHARGFMNYDMWKEHPDLLESFGMFEAYFVRRDAYLTDSGAKWRGALSRDIPSFEQFDNVVGAVETVKRFNGLQEGIMQLLVHPCWWDL